jgi:hypothetical protein
MACSGEITIQAQNPTVEATVANSTWGSPPRSSGTDEAVVIEGLPSSLRARLPAGVGAPAGFGRF